jgi:ABC-2 type transport system permease protein
MTGMMRIFRYELWRHLRRGGYLFMTVGIPIIAIVGYFAITAIQEYRAQQPQPQEEVTAPPPGVNLPGGGIVQAIGVVDLSGTIEKSSNERLVLYPSEDAAKQALHDATISYYYLIAPDYIKTGAVSMHFERVSLTSVDNRSLRRLMIEGLASKQPETVDPNLIKRLQFAPSITPNSVSEQGETQQRGSFNTNFAVVYIFALALLFTAFTTSGYLMQSVVEEKETRMVEVILSSVRPRDLLTGKVLALSVLGLLQMVLWFGAVLFILQQLTSRSVAGAIPLVGFSLTNNQIVVLIVYFILGYLYFAAAYAAIGALASNMREGPQLAAIVTLPAAVPMWATSLFAVAPDSPPAVILSMFPLTSPLAMVMRATLTEIPLIQFIISAALLAATVVLIMWLAGRIFRVNVLLSGQMPKFRDLWRLVSEKA